MIRSQTRKVLQIAWELLPKPPPPTLSGAMTWRPRRKSGNIHIASTQGLGHGQHQEWASLDFEKWLPAAPLYFRPGPLTRDMWASVLPLQVINT